MLALWCPARQEQVQAGKAAPEGREDSVAGVAANSSGVAEFREDRAVRASEAVAEECLEGAGEGWAVKR